MVGPNPDEQHKLLRRAARGSLLNLVGAAVSAVSAFGLTLIVARSLPEAQAGVFFSATSLFVIAAGVCQLGTDNGLVYFIARNRRSETPQPANPYFRTALIPVIAISVAAAIFLTIFSSNVASWVGSDDRSAEFAIRVLAAFLPFAGLEAVALSATRGTGTMRPYTLIEQIARPGLQLVLAGAIILIVPSFDLAWSWALPYGVAGIWAYIWWRRMSRGAISELAPRTVARDFWRFTAPRSVASITQIAMQRLDIVLVAALAGAPAAALYTAATRFVVLGQLARNAVSLAVQPHLASAMANKDDPQTVKQLYQVSTSWLMLVTWPIFVVMLVDGPILMRVFGGNYESAAVVITLLAASMLVATLCGDVDIMLIMSGRTTWSLVNTMTAFLINLVLDLWLIPQLGILGAAIGWSVGIVLKNTMALVQVGLIFKLHPIGRAVVIVALGSSTCFVAPLLLSNLVFGLGALSLIVGGGVGSAMYLGVLWVARSSLHIDMLMRRRRAKSA